MSNFTPRAQQVLALARKEADRFNHNFVGTEHLLLGLIKLGQGVAVNVLQKMGLDLDEFIAMMYEMNSDGDWREFGDEAVKLKWIDHSVDRIWEMSIDKNPGRFGSSVIFAQDELLKEELGDDL